ncbi:MAG: hypothetical protein V2A79_13890 [Planctomycetota bacterium]
MATHVRDRGLAILDGVLREVTRRFPEVEFLSSDKLALRILESVGQAFQPVLTGWKAGPTVYPGLTTWAILYRP